MNNQPSTAELVHQHIRETGTHVQSWAEAFINSEVEQLQATNQAEIAVLQERQPMVADRRKVILDQVREYGYPKPEGRRLASAAWHLFVFIVLTVGAYTFSVATLKEFNIGADTRWYCAAVAIMLAGSIDYFLRKFQAVQLLQKLVATFLLIAAAATAAAFTLVRGDVMAHQLNFQSAVLIDNMNPLQSDPGNSEQVVVWLRLAMLAAAIGGEVLAGISLSQVREALRITNSEHAQRLQKELLATEKELLAITARLHQLLSAPARLRAALWASVNRGLMDGFKPQSSGFRRVAGLILGAILTGFSAQADQMNVVIGLDLSKTQAVMGYDKKSEFDKNKQAVSVILANLPAGCRVQVIGIGGHTFSNPIDLLVAHTAADSGYFSNRLFAGRRTLLLEWQKRSKMLEPSFDQTDLLGFFRLLSFSHTTGSRRIVVLSDMRQFSRGELDLETPALIPVEASLKKVEKQGGFASLNGSLVYVLGAGDPGKKGIAYWQGLREFWKEFIHRSNGTLRVFSPTRQTEVLKQITALP